MKQDEIRAAALAASVQIYSTVVAASVAVNVSGSKTTVTADEVLDFAEFFEYYIGSGR